MEAPLLDINGLTVSFTSRSGDVPALADVSATVGPGEVLGLVGESGCGKSTVALAVMRDLGRNGRIVSGSIRFKEIDLATMPERQLRRLRGREISMVYQEPLASLNPAMSVGSQLMEVPMIHGRASRRAARVAVQEILEAVRLPDAGRILAAYPHQLSGGQQQRVVIAMALMTRPALLILDEPTTALDVTVEAGIIDLLGELRQRTGTAMLFISHNLGLVRQVADRICVMYSGQVVETGPAAAVLGATRHPYTRGLLRSIPLPGTDRAMRPIMPISGSAPLPHERPPGCVFGPRCPHFEAGICDDAPVPMRPVSVHHSSRCRRFDAIDWNAPPPSGNGTPPLEVGERLIRADGVGKRYAISSGLFGGAGRVLKANKDVTFEAREAETLAIVGESGCGKSTLARILVGLETASEGTLTFAEHEIGALPVGRRDRETVAAIQMVFQNPFDTLNPSMRVGTQIVRALERFGIGRGASERRARMLDLLDRVGLPRVFAGRLPRQLSGGQKQRVGIARAFAGTPRIVVADEPVSALDVSVQASVLELLGDIQREHRTTLLLISHDLGLVRYMADRVMVMFLGHVVEIGTIGQVFAPPHHPYTEALLSAAPVIDPEAARRRVILDGELPSPIHPPAGCPFQTRCHRKHLVTDGLCERELPPLRDLGSGHCTRCHLDAGALMDAPPLPTDR